MRTKHWIVAVLAVAAIGSVQAYAVTGDRRPQSQQAAADSPTSPDIDFDDVSDVDTPEDLPQAIVAQINAQPAQVETVIVGFKNGVDAKVKEAIVRAAGAVPTETVPGPETIVATIDRAELDAAVQKLDASLLVDYVAVPESVPDDVTSLLK